MTSATASLPAPAAVARVWPGRFAEFLLVGGATLVVFPLVWLYSRVAGLEPSELTVSWVAFYAAYVINDPHFAVTYLLFYRDAKDRALGTVFGTVQRWRYLAVGFVAPLVLGAWAITAIASASAETLGWMIQLMFLLVGWHYTKQGFGVLSVLSARRGISFSAVERRVILAHCYAGWAYAWGRPFDPGSPASESGVEYTTLAHPWGFELFALVAFAASTVALFWILAKKQRSEGRLPLGPLAAFLITVWVWTVYSSFHPLMIYVIPALHSIQYLYFVSLLKRNVARHEERSMASSEAPSFKVSVASRLAILAATALGLGWVLFHAAPGVLDEQVALRGFSQSADALGPTPYLAAFVAFVNIHHYLMDWVIWRRENPETKHLRPSLARGAEAATAR